MNLIDLLRPSRNLLPPSNAAAFVAATGQVAGHADTLSLADAPIGQPCRVTAVHAPEAAPQWARWLAEIGFMPGEPVSVRTRSPWGDGALVVRIGTSSFALRREEADCVCVVLEAAIAR